MQIMAYGDLIWPILEEVGQLTVFSQRQVPCCSAYCLGKSARWTHTPAITWFVRIQSVNYNLNFLSVSEAMLVHADGLTSSFLKFATVSLSIIMMHYSIIIDDKNTLISVWKRSVGLGFSAADLEMMIIASPKNPA